MTTPRELAMFPLGSVLLPGMMLPLHVFEPRYREMASHVVEGAGAGEFGVTLIERGSEVGGGDERSPVGVVAHVVDSERFDDGRWGIVAVGTRRIQVAEWLADDPWPRALVRDWPDEPGTTAPEALSEMVATSREIAALARRLGHSVDDPSPQPGTDTTTAVWHLIVRSPLGPSDRYRLLSCAGPTERAALTRELFAEQRDLLSALAGSDGT